MKQVTVEMLERLDACRDQVKLFRATFGEAAELTEGNGMKAAATGLDIYWLAFRVLTGERLAEYKRVRAAASAEYQRVTAPAWAEYQRVTAAASAEYQRVTAPAWAEYQRVTAAASAEYQRVRAAASAEYKRVRAAAFVRLAAEEEIG